MELSEYSVFASNCFRDTPPPCAAVCPLAYDVREFIKLMRKGSVRSAYKLIRSSLIFPSVITKVCPEDCRKSCVRGRLEAEESVDLKSLEQICVDKMAGKDPDRYNIPQKQQKTAVIGGGLSGLACAYRLASYGYQVSLYEKETLLGGNLPGNVDKVWANEEFAREFRTVRCEFRMGSEVSSLAEITADAIYIATGEGGDGFRSLGDISFTGLVIRGGALTGADLMESVRMGLTAAEKINNRLLTNSSDIESSSTEVIDLTAQQRSADDRFYDLHYDYSVPEEIPEKGAPEAFRCMRCNCSECYNICPLMEKHKQYPKKICNEIIVTLKPNKSRRTAVRMIMGCTECGMCREACPENIDMGKCLQEARTDFYESGVMSPAFHDYWLRDMEFCLSDEASLIKVTDPERSSDVLYYPGCQLSASMPELSIKSFEAICRCCDNPAIMLSCCGVPAKWAGLAEEYEKIRENFIAAWEDLGRPLVVTACPSCLENLKSLHPDMETVSYYHFASAHPEIITANDHKCEGHCEQNISEKVKVIDPCSSVSEQGMAEDVRILLKSAGYEVINREPDPACCGFGGHIYNAVPELHDRFAVKRIDGGTEADLISAAYCANCRDIIAYNGADARHVLGLILGVDETMRKPPELSLRREGRRIVKNYFADSGTGDQGSDKTEDSCMKIMINEELIRKMDRDLILREQVADIIEEAERTGKKLFDEEDNIFIAHKKLGAVTIWVRYSYSGDNAADCVMVENVYYHRMDIREDA